MIKRKNLFLSLFIVLVLASIIATVYFSNASLSPADSSASIKSQQAIFYKLVYGPIIPNVNNVYAEFMAKDLISGEIKTLFRVPHFLFNSGISPDKNYLVYSTSPTPSILDQTFHFYNLYTGTTIDYYVGNDFTGLKLGVNGKFAIGSYSPTALHGYVTYGQIVNNTVSVKKFDTYLNKRINVDALDPDGDFTIFSTFSKTELGTSSYIMNLTTGSKIEFNSYFGLKNPPEAFLGVYKRNIYFTQKLAGSYPLIIANIDNRTVNLDTHYLKANKTCTGDLPFVGFPSINFTSGDVIYSVTCGGTQSHPFEFEILMKYNMNSKQYVQLASVEDKILTRYGLPHYFSGYMTDTYGIFMMFNITIGQTSNELPRDLTFLQNINSEQRSLLTPDLKNASFSSGFTY